jgi:tetratricopeptide (TPR) repeat protein
MNENATQLDAEELLHFAIRASQNKQNERAILYLKHAITQDPDNARLHYFLGAQHAEIGMYDRAVEEMTRAVEIDPALETAHFQLGLLHVTSARVTEAEQAWQALDALGENHPLYLFKTGLLHLTRDEFDQARSHLSKGIELNQQNPDLNRDMLRILNDIEEVAPQNGSTAGATDSNPDTNSEEQTTQRTSGNHIFLSAYNKDEEDDDTKH